MQEVQNIGRRSCEKQVMQDFTDYSDVRIDTRDLILKKAWFEDWESLYHNIWCQEESAKHMLWNVTKSEEEARERMRKTLCFQKTQKYAFIVYEKSSGTAIGFAGMREVEPGVFEDTGVAIGPAFCGRGYGKQILNALVKEAKNCGASRFMASARVKNLASHKLQMSCGFDLESFSEEREDPRTGEVYIVENNVKYL
jgi:RimJ/RimL family protein N-acetyltransferase